MEIQLSELIEQIKKDGVESAEAEAKTIVASARAEADRIIAEAKAEAAEIQKKAKEENERLVRSSEEAIRQAGRNLLISFRKSVGAELSAVVSEKVSASFSPDAVCELIPKVVEAYAKSSGEDDLAVLLSAEDIAKVEGALLSALKDRMLQGVTLKAGDGINGGFRISVENGGAYYDYSAEAVSDMLSAYLTPKVASLMKEAGRE